MFVQITLAEQWQKVMLLSGQLMSDSLQPHGLQHTRLPCPSLSPRVCSNSFPLSEWCYLTILSFSIPFSFCLQSFPASGSFPVSGLFTSGGQILELQLQHQSFNEYLESIPLGLTGWISLLSKGLSRTSTTIQKHQFFSIQPSLWSASHIHTWLLEKLQLWLYRPLSVKWCFCFLIHCLGLLKHFYQGASVF